jgi:hypothetical protein
VLIHATARQAWADAETALADLERRFHIPPLAPGDAATDDGPEGFEPIA